MPAISIVIPTYNGAEYLCECLDSVLDQSYTDFEIIIVDDTSKDATLKIAREYAHRDKRITIHENSINLGLVGNWNRCVEIARADWIKFVFQDDYLYPDCLRALYEAARPEVGVAGCVRKILFDGVSDKVRAEYELLQRDHSIENLVANSEVISADNFCNLVLDNMGFNFVGEPTAVMLHRSVFKRFGSFNPNLVQMCDFEYWARIACNTGFSFVREELAAFRVHGTNTSMKNYHEKSFRSEMLEVAVLLHEYLYNPHFEPLRRAAARKRPSVDLKALLSDKAYWCYATARSMAKDPVNPSKKPMEEWNAIAAMMPALREPLHFAMKDFGHMLDRTVLWRFKRQLS